MGSPSVPFDLVRFLLVPGFSPFGCLPFGVGLPFVPLFLLPFPWFGLRFSDVELGLPLPFGRLLLEPAFSFGLALHGIPFTVGMLSSKLLVLGIQGDLNRAPEVMHLPIFAGAPRCASQAAAS